MLTIALMNYNKFLLLLALICAPVIGRAVTVITGLPYTITAPGTYVLESNLTANNTDGIVVDASNVSINLGPYALIQAQPFYHTTGINVGHVDNVNIQNGTITGFTVGVVLGAPSSTLKNSYVFTSQSPSPYSDGVQVTANDCQVENCTLVFRAGYSSQPYYYSGIEIVGCGGVKVRDCQISGYPYGISTDLYNQPSFLIGNYESNCVCGLILNAGDKYQKNVTTNCYVAGGIAVGRENG